MKTVHIHYSAFAQPIFRTPQNELKIAQVNDMRQDTSNTHPKSFGVTLSSQHSANLQNKTPDLQKSAKVTSSNFITALWATQSSQSDNDVKLLARA